MRFVCPQLRQEKKQLTAHWDASTRHLFLAWSAPPASSPDYAALSVAADLLTTHLSMDPKLSRRAKMPMATCDMESVFLISIQVKPGADIEAVRDKLLKHVDQLSLPGGISDLEVAMIRQRITQALRPECFEPFHVSPTRFPTDRSNEPGVAIDRQNIRLWRLEILLRSYGCSVERSSQGGCGTPSHVTESRGPSSRAVELSSKSSLLGCDTMSFLTRTVVWANWQFGVLKLAMLALGIMIGACFADFFKPYLWLFGLVFLATTIWVTIMWVRAMRKTA